MMEQMQYERRDAQRDAELSFKRHILEQSSGFVCEPAADMYRLNLLGMMLTRYDELKDCGLSDLMSLQRTILEYEDIGQRMQEAGFEPQEEFGEDQLTENEAIQYIEERQRFLNKRMQGVAICVASMMPLLVMGMIAEFLFSDICYLIGLLASVALVGLGVYMIVSVRKPRDEERVRYGAFSLSVRVRRKMEQYAETVKEKAKKRRGIGVLLMVISILPVILSNVLAEMFLEDAWLLAGVSGMLVMVAIGIYQICMGQGERKTMNNLLDK